MIEPSDAMAQTKGAEPNLSSAANNDLLPSPTPQAIEARLLEQQRVLMQQMEERLMREMEERLMREWMRKKDGPPRSIHEAVLRSHASAPQSEGSEEIYFSMPKDVFSMLCLFDANSWPFLYALFIFLAKLFFYAVVLAEIILLATLFPKDISNAVKVTQLVMLPVTVIVTDKGVLAALFVYQHFDYDDQIFEQHRLSTRFRYTGSNFARFLDAIVYQIVLFFVLLQAEKVLDIFLNFAALRFLMEVDKAAFVVAANGYLTEEMYDAAKGVESIKLRGKESDFRQHTAKLFFAFSLIAMIAAWALIQYILA